MATYNGVPVTRDNIDQVEDAMDRSLRPNIATAGDLNLGDTIVNPTGRPLTVAKIHHGEHDVIGLQFTNWQCITLPDSTVVEVIR